MGVIIGILLVAAIIGFFLMYNTLTWGLVCFKFWYWFGLPVFVDLPHIDFWQAVGLTFFFSLFKNNDITHRKSDDDEKQQSLYNFFLAPWLVLIIGWAFKSWIY